MAETIGEAYLQIKPSMEGISDELSEALGSAAESGSKSFGGKLTSALSAVGKVGAAAVGATVAATGALVGNLMSSTSALAEYGDNIDKMSQKMGISAEAYQEWEAVMQHSGTSMETLKASMKTMASAVESGNEAFERLGISEEEVANLSQEDLFARVISGLQDMGESSERTYLAGQLLGRGATELGALLNTSAEDTEAMKQAVHDLGGVLSDDTVKAAAGFQDALQDMQTAVSGFKRSAVADFLPSVTQMMNGVSQIFSGDVEGGLASINEGVEQFIGNMTDILPKVVEIGTGIVKALATAIIENLPELASAAMDVVGDLASFFLENVPMFLQTGLEIILTIAEGIIDNLSEIIPAVVDVILTIVEKLTEPDTLVQLIDAALKLIIALAEGLLKALPKLIEKAPIIIANLVVALVNALPLVLEAAVKLVQTIINGIVGRLKSIAEAGAKIITTIKDAITAKIEQAKTWGKDLIDNFVQGIKDKIQAVKDVVSNVAQTVRDFLGFSEPDYGPLADFHEFAPDMLDLFASGIKSNIDTIKDAVGMVAQAVSGEMSGEDIVVNSNISRTVATSAVESAPQMAAAGAGGDITIPVYIGSELIDRIVVNAQTRSNYRSGGR